MKDLHFVLRKTEKIGKKLTFQGSSRNRGAGALFDLAHEHAKAIAFLIENELMGSAYALVRSCIEAYIRGSWFLHCASDEQVKKYLGKDTKWPNLAQQMTELESLHCLPDMFKNRYMGKTMGVMDGLTHGLSSQINRRYNENHLEFKVDEKEIEEIIREVSFISILAHAGIVEMSDNKEMNQHLEEILEELIAFN